MAIRRNETLNWQKCVAFIVATGMSAGVLNAYAGTAQTLPKGVSQVGISAYFYGNITKRYDPDGNKEDLAVDYNGALDSSVFPALAPLDPLVGGAASIGDSVVDFKFKYKTAEFEYYYGVSDRLSVGIKVPYFDAKNKVNATVDTTSANVGTNPLYQAGVLPPPLNDSPVIPLGLGVGETPFTDEQVQGLLGKGVDVNGDGTIDIPGYNYKRFETWGDSGFGDIELTGKYRFYEKGPWRMAAGGGARLRTGRQDDPDNLTDLAYGTGQNALLLNYYVDYIGVDNLVLNLSLEYANYLKTDKNLRIPRDVNEPITDNKENVERDLGDVIQLELSGAYEITDFLIGGLKYEYTREFKDSIKGDQNYNYKSLEDETDQRSHVYVVSLTYSTIQQYLDKRARIPFTASLSYRDRFAGKNNINVSEYIGASFSLFF